MSSPSDIFSISIEDGKITIQTSPDLAKELIYVLSTLLDLSKAIQTKVIHARAIAAAANQDDIQRRQLQFKETSVKIFSRYQEHLTNGCNGDRSAALQCIKKDFNIGYGEAKVYVTEGRRLTRKARRAPSSV
jgi:hypothetical protein